MDELFQLILFALFILFGLLSGIKKKKPSPPPRTSRPAQRPGQSVRRTRAPQNVERLETPGRTVRGPSARGPTRQTAVPRQTPVTRKPEPKHTPVSGLEELFELLQERAERREVEDREVEQREVEERLPEPELYVERVEARERAGVPKSEAKPRLDQPVNARQRSGGKGLELNAETARQGIILAEVLGPPKGLRE